MNDFDPDHRLVWKSYGNTDVPQRVNVEQQFKQVAMNIGFTVNNTNTAIMWNDDHREPLIVMELISNSVVNIRVLIDGGRSFSSKDLSIANFFDRRDGNDIGKVIDRLHTRAMLFDRDQRHHRYMMEQNTKSLQQELEASLL